MKCEKCGVAIVADTQFCSHCGARQKAAQHVVWPACGLGCVGVTAALFGFMGVVRIFIATSYSDIPFYGAVMWQGIVFAIGAILLFAWRLLRP